MTRAGRKPGMARAARQPVRSVEHNRSGSDLLKRLCRYYLSCLLRENTGLSISPSEVGLTFIELNGQAASEEIPRDDPVQTLLDRNRERERQTELILGTPILITSRRHQLRMEPLVLCPVTKGETGGPLRSLPASVGLNPRAIQYLSRCGQDETEAAVAALEEELGLGGDPPAHLEETLTRLRHVRPSWPWFDGEPDEDGAKPVAAAELKEYGIHDRMILAVRERSEFVAGLTSELTALSRLSDEDIEGTALGAWLSASFPVEKSGNPGSLLDLPPLNEEQRRAIEATFCNGLTVVTGPPGTGKSQLVSGLLVNAAWRDTRVLLASKNNKAVDVVEARVNGLGSQPAMLRAGSGQYRGVLASTLVAILNANLSPGIKERYKAAVSLHRDLAVRIDTLDREITERIRRRNRLDRLEKSVEELRPNLVDMDLGQFDWNRIGKAKAAADELLSCLNGQARPLVGNSLKRTATRLFQRSRADRAVRLARNIDDVVRDHGFGLPPGEPLSEGRSWQQYARQVHTWLSNLLTWHEYLEALEGSYEERLDQIHGEALDLRRRFQGVSEQVWKMWIENRPARLSDETRQAIARQRTALELASGGGELTGEAYAAFRRATETAVAHLGLWGCTALSAGNTLPLKPGFFDLVVIDEASQCDIASVLPLLYRAKRAMIIGDPNQLRHISGLTNTADLAALQRHGLQPDFTHWSYHASSLFDLASSLAGPEGRITLVEHHRSHPDIIGFSDHEFYSGKLRVVTAPTRLKVPRTRFETSHLIWVDCRGQVEQPPQGGAGNRPEAERVVQTLKRLIGSSRYQGSIGIVTPFRHQAELIGQIIHRDRRLSQEIRHEDIAVDTVHRFQGDERDLMIFSPVLSRGMPVTAYRFLIDTPNLFNVAVTRARAMLVVVGDRHAFRNSKGHLKAFESYVGRLQAGAPDDEQNGPVQAAVADQTSSPWIHVLFQALRDAGLDTEYGFRLGPITLDLALFHGERKLDIEVDTEFHRQEWTREDGASIQVRDQRLFELGWEVRRFWVCQVRDSLPQCVAIVRAWSEGRE